MATAARLSLLAGLIAALPAQAAYLAGVARVDITPKAPMWMSGYASRTKPSNGVVHSLWAKAVALRDSRNHTVVIVTTDLIGLPRVITDRVSVQIQQKYSIDRAGLMFNSSHTHTGPLIRSNLTTMFDLPADAKAQVEEYANELTNKLVSVVGAALGTMRTVEVSFGTGQAGFAVNRRQQSAGGVRIGVNPEGPVDRSVPVLKIAGKDGKLLAIVVGYACHNTTLTGEFYELSGDYAGFAQIEVEKANPGATALFVMLCGGDANPNPRSSLDLARTHGGELAASAQKVLAGPMTKLDGNLKSGFEETRLRFAPHTRETFETEASTSKIPAAVRRAKAMLAKYDEGSPVRDTPYPVQAISFGRGLTLLALGGEVVIDYTLRAKREYPKANLVVLGYSNDVMCYIPSQRVLREGGYEAVDSMIYYGQPGPFADDVEESVFAAVERVMRRVGIGKR